MRTSPRLTLGPVYFLWEGAKWRDFYFKIADEAPVDRVVIGETVCSKRMHFMEPYVADVVDRLTSSGKEVVLSSLASVTLDREAQLVRSLSQQDEYVVEANDISALHLLAGQATYHRAAGQCLQRRDRTLAGRPRRNEHLSAAGTAFKVGFRYPVCPSRR